MCVYLSLVLVVRIAPARKARATPHHGAGRTRGARVVDRLSRLPSPPREDRRRWRLGLCRHHHGGAGPPIVVVAQALRPAERRLGLRRTTAATAIAALPPLRQPPAARRSHSATIPSPPPGCREFGRELEGWSLVGGLRARRLVPGGPSSHPTHSCAGRLAAAPHRAPQGAPRAEHPAAAGCPFTKSVHS